MDTVVEALGSLLGGFTGESRSDGPGGSRERVVLVGYSMGARVALQLCTSRALSPDALVLLSGTAGIKNPASRVARYQRDTQIARLLGWDPPHLNLTETEPSPGLPVGSKGEHGSGGSIGMAGFLQWWYGQPMWDTLRAHPAFLQVLLRRLAAVDAPDSGQESGGGDLALGLAAERRLGAALVAMSTGRQK